MLVLKRKPQEVIRLTDKRTGEVTRIVIVGKATSIGIEAVENVEIAREELLTKEE